MKIPDHFIIQLPINSNGQRIKDLLDKELITFSYAKNLYTGGRYSNNNIFKINVILKENYDKTKVRAIYLIFKKQEK